MTKLLTVVFAALLLTFNAAAQTEKINWRTDLQKARQEALETGKPLLLDFTAEWCKPCKKMDKEFWVLNDVINATKSFIAVKIDFDKDKESANEYRVTGVPMVVITDPLGNLITFRRGFAPKNAGELNDILKNMPSNFSVLKPAYTAVKSNPNDGLALLEIANFYRASGMFDLSSDYYTRALATEAVKADAEKLELATATIGLNPFAMGDYRAANKLVSDYIKIYPEGKYKEIAFAVLTIGNAKLGNIREAEKYLEILKTEYPSSANLRAAGEAVENAKKQIVN